MLVASSQTTPSGPQADILALQRTVGNQVVSQWLEAGAEGAPPAAIIGELPEPTKTDASGATVGGAIGGVVGGIGGIVAGIALAPAIGVGLAALAGLGIAGAALLLGLRLGALFGSSANARRNAQVVKVTPSIPEPIYDHALRGDEIRTKSTNPSAADRAGLTSAPLFGSQQLTPAYSLGRKKDGKFAYWIHNLEFSFGFREITVWIAKEYPEGSCEFTVTREHENEHVALDRRLVREYADKIRRAMLEFMSLPTEQEPLWVSSEAEGDAAIERIKVSVAEGAIGPLYAELREKLHRGNRELDSPENYQKVYDKCDNW